MSAPEKALLPPSLSKLGTFKSLPQNERGEDAWGEDLLGNGALLMLVSFCARLHCESRLFWQTEEEDKVDDECAQADHGMEVTMMISGRIQGGGAVFLPKSKISYRVGFEAGRVVQGVALAVRVMREGQKSVLRINNPMLGYGESERELDGVHIPADSLLEYELELLVVGTAPSELSAKRQFEIASGLAAEGKVQFSESHWEEAEGSYEQAIELLQNLKRKVDREEDVAVPHSDVKGLLLRCGNNLAVVFLKLGKHQMALEACDQVLKQEPHNLKALCQKGRLLTMLGGEANLASAEEALRRAAELHPSSVDVTRETKALKKKQNGMKQDEKEMISRMLGAPKPQSEVKVADPPKPIVPTKKDDSVMRTVLLSALVVLASSALGCYLSGTTHL